MKQNLIFGLLLLLVNACMSFTKSEFEEANEKAFEKRYGNEFTMDEFSGKIYNYIKGTFKNQYILTIYKADDSFISYFLCDVTKKFQINDSVYKYKDDRFLMINSEEYDILNDLCKP